MHWFTHDCAYGGMVAILDYLRPYIPQEQRQEVAQTVYKSILAILEMYEVSRERQIRRLNPTQN